MSKNYEVIDDELKRLCNQCIGRLLTNLGETIPPVAVKEIKHQIRLLEKNLRDNEITAKEHEHEKISFTQ